MINVAKALFIGCLLFSGCLMAVQVKCVHFISMFSGDRDAELEVKQLLDSGYKLEGFSCGDNGRCCALLVKY